MCVFITTGSTKKSYKDHFMRTHVKASPQNTNKENDIHLWPRGSALSGEVPLRGSRSRRAAAGAEPCGLRASAGQGGGGSGAGSPRRRGRRLRRRCPSWTGFAHYPPSAPAPARRTHARGTPPAPLKGSDDETREPSPNKAPEPPRTPVTRREDRAESPADPTARPGPRQVRRAEAPRAPVPAAASPRRAHPSRRRAPRGAPGGPRAREERGRRPHEPTPSPPAPGPRPAPPSHGLLPARRPGEAAAAGPSALPLGGGPRNPAARAPRRHLPGAWAALRPRRAGCGSREPAAEAKAAPLPSARRIRSRGRKERRRAATESRKGRAPAPQLRGGGLRDVSEREASSRPGELERPGEGVGRRAGGGPARRAGWRETARSAQGLWSRR